MMKNKEMTMETKKEIFEDYMEDYENFLHPAPAIERCMDRLMKLGLTRSAAVGAYHDFLLED